MYNNFTEEARRILVGAKEEMMKLKHPYVGSEHLLLSILKNDNNISVRLKDYLIDYNVFREKLIDIVGIGKKQSECFLYTPLLKRVMENAVYDSKENNSGDVTVNHLFSALLEEGEGVAIRILIGMNIDIDDLYKDFAYKIPTKKRNKKLLIESMGVDLTKKASNNELDPVVGRDNEIKRIVEILCRRKKNNPILIGSAGVGKTAIVEELSNMIVKGNVPNSLKNKKIISLDMASMVAGTKYRGEFEERVNKVLKELEENDDIIVFIDEIHTLVGAGGAEGAIDASNIFKPALARNKMQLIGATTTEEYKKFILKDKALDRRFQKVDINEPNKDTVKNILMRLKETYSNFHKVEISEEIIDYIIKVSDMYIKFRKEPDRSIDILDEVGSYASLKSTKKSNEINKLNEELNNILKKKKDYLIKNDFDNASLCKKEENKLLTKINKLELNNKVDNIVTKKDVDNVISSMCNIPIYELNSNNSKEINNLSKYLKDNILGEDIAITELLNVYKKIKLGLNDNKCHSIMFYGPVGVGKTKLAKLFGNKISNNVIKIDASEYSEAHSISKLIGTAPGYVGYDDNKNIFESKKDNPFSVVILDNIDKAHSSIINLFYQILDDGKLVDSKGDTIYFNNTIIIMTTSVDYNNIGFNKKESNELKEYFGISFINCIDNIIRFNKLDKSIVEKIISKNIKSLKEKYMEKGIKFSINDKVKNEIIRLSDYEECGARKIESIIKKHLDSIIIDNVLLNKDNISIKQLTVYN